MRAVIVMGADQKYIERVKRCYRGVAPFEMNAQYADLNGYGLRLYIDDDIPFLQRHNKNALMGELRKVFALADAARPGGPHFGVWKTKAQFDEPDFVMWVDSDAHLTPSNLTRNQIFLGDVCIFQIFQCLLPLRGPFGPPVMAVVGGTAKGFRIDDGWHSVPFTTSGMWSRPCSVDMHPWSE